MPAMRKSDVAERILPSSSRPLVVGTPEAQTLERAMLLSDDDPVARANAARALGAAEDKDSFDLLLEAAISDDDSRVRVLLRRDGELDGGMAR